MSKFKIGDRVRFCSKINPDKRGFKNGDIFTIQAVSNFTYSVNRTQAYSVGEVYVVFENELTLITNSEIHITTDGKTTHAVLKENGKVTKRAKADCSPDDDFDFKVGARLAFNRLFGEEEPKQIPAEFWERFKTKKIAVVCKNERESKEFLLSAKEQGFTTNSGNSIEKLFESKYLSDVLSEHGNVAYGFGVKIGENKGIWISTQERFTINKWNYTVITYTDLINGKLPEKFEPHLMVNGKNYGIIGTETIQEDLAGERLKVGDTVLLYGDSCGLYGEHTVCSDDERPDGFVMGTKCPKFIRGRSGAFSIIKKRSYTEIADGEIVGSIKYIKSEEMERPIK